MSISSCFAIPAPTHTPGLGLTCECRKPCDETCTRKEKGKREEGKDTVESDLSYHSTISHPPHSNSRPRWVTGMILPYPSAVLVPNTAQHALAR